MDTHGISWDKMGFNGFFMGSLGFQQTYPQITTQEKTPKNVLISNSFK